MRLFQQFEQDGKFDIVNDMALIKLNAPVKFSKYVKPICLPNPGIQLDINSKCYATGWGVTRGKLSSVNTEYSVYFFINNSNTNTDLSLSLIHI